MKSILSKLYTAALQKLHAELLRVANTGNDIDIWEEVQRSRGKITTTVVSSANTQSSP